MTGAAMDLRGVRAASSFRLETCPCGALLLVSLDLNGGPICSLHIPLEVGVEVAQVILTHREKVAAVAQYGVCGHG